MRWIALIVVFLALGSGTARAESDFSVLRAAPSADLAIPFWCEWGYDWDEVCYRDAYNRLPVGGDVDKVWRSALRFPLGAIPPGAVVMYAQLELSSDGICLAPRMEQRACPARTYTIDIHPVFSPTWNADREVEFGPLVSRGSFWARARERLVFDVTDLVIEWVEYGAPNHGFLLKLADGEETFSVSGPKFPSSEFPNAALRPALEVAYYMP